MKTLRIHYLQHVHFEEPGFFEIWANANNHNLTPAKFFEPYKLPDIDHFDWLIVMGGPMSVNEEEIYPWLKAEKQFIKSAIAGNKTVIGVCLGAQLVAGVLGSKIYPAKKKEIGWFPVSKTPQAKKEKLLNDVPETFTVLHWHGETFDLPKGAKHLMQTDICPNQAFLYGDRVLGFQFHLESTPETLESMVDKCGHELIPDEFVQSEQKISEGTVFCQNTNKYLSGILDFLAKTES